MTLLETALFLLRITITEHILTTAEAWHDLTRRAATALSVTLRWASVATVFAGAGYVAFTPTLPLLPDPGRAAIFLTCVSGLALCVAIEAGSRVRWGRYRFVMPLGLAGVTSVWVTSIARLTLA
jgi:hypothetical protein